MLRKRNGSLQKDQYKGQLMSGSSSESCFQSDILEQKQKNPSLFSVPGMFVGFSTKGLLDSESAKSPTSPLDYRVFSNLGYPFRSPRSPSNGSKKSWDCRKVGLGIVDSLNEETRPFGKVLASSESRNILFGSRMRMDISSSQSHLFGSNNSFSTPNSLPKDYAITPNTQIKSYCPGNSENVIVAGKVQLEPGPLEKVRSFLSDSGRSASPLTNLAYLKTNSSSEDFWVDKKTIRAVSPPLISGGSNFDKFLGVKPSSLPISIGSGCGLMESISASEMELSEDYTCVISHGPNPRKTHIFCDCILECHTNELESSKNEEQGIGLPPEVKCSDGSVWYPMDDFLSFCYSCKKKLEEGKDIYMYRGEKAFCSCSCRAEEILVEEEMEKTINNSSENSPTSAYPEEIFMTGMVIAP